MTQAAKPVPPRRAFAPAVFLALLSLAPVPPGAAAATLTYNPGAGPHGLGHDHGQLAQRQHLGPLAEHRRRRRDFRRRQRRQRYPPGRGHHGRRPFFQTTGYALTGGNLALGGAVTSVVTLNPGVNAAFHNVLTGGFTKAGPGTLTLAGANTFTNGLTVSAGAVAVSADANLGAAASVLTLHGGTLNTSASFAFATGRSLVLGAGGGTLAPAAGTTLTANGVLSGSGALTVAGASTTSTLVLGGTNTFTGGVSLTGGTLRVGADANFGNAAGALALGNGTTLNATATLSSARAVSLPGGSATLDVNAGLTLTLSGVVSGSGGLVKTNAASTLSLPNANNTFTGGTVIQGGTLLLGGDNSLGGASSGLTLNNGATLQTSTAVKLASTRTVNLSGGSTFHVTGNTLTADAKLSGTGGLNKTGTGTLSLTHGGNNFSGTVAVTAGTLVIGSDANLGNTNNAISLSGGASLQVTGNTILSAGRAISVGTGGGTVNVNSGVNFTVNQTPTGNALTKAGSGTLVLGGDNSAYTGGFTLAAGTVSFAANTHLGDPATALTFNGGTLAPSTTLALETGATPRPLVVNAGGGVLNPGTNVTLTVPGVLSGSSSGTLTKNGNGTVNLSGTANTFAGTTNVASGVLNLQASNAVNGTVNGLGGTLALQTASGSPAGGGSVNLNAGTLTYAPTGAGTTAAVTLAGNAGQKINYGSGGTLALNKGGYSENVALTVGPLGAASASLVRSSFGALVLTPAGGSATTNFGVSERLIVNGGLPNTHGMVTPTIVVQNNNVQKSADFVRDDGGSVGLVSAASGYTAFNPLAGILGTTSFLNVAAAGSSATVGGQVYALRVGNGGTGTPSTLAVSTLPLTVGSGSGQAGVILTAPPAPAAVRPPSPAASWPSAARRPSSMSATPAEPSPAPSPAPPA